MHKKTRSIFFSLHTTTGMLVSLLLFIIFFAGAFTLFKDDIQLWQEHRKVENIDSNQVSFDSILNQLDKSHSLYGRDITMRFRKRNPYIYVYMTASKDSSEVSKPMYLYVDKKTGQAKTYHNLYNLGEFLYRLHFFDQIPYPYGRTAAGIVALLFLLTIISGIAMQWHKIGQTFHGFSKHMSFRFFSSKLHIAMGVLGIPFQVIYAITGSYFVLSMLVLFPALAVYHQDKDQLMNDMRPQPVTAQWQSKTTSQPASFDTFVSKAENYWPDYEVDTWKIKNYGDQGASFVAIGQSPTIASLTQQGTLIYDNYSHTLRVGYAPKATPFVVRVQQLMYRLHFANYGGLMVKYIYFILAILTNIVILSGVYIYSASRQSKKYSPKTQRITYLLGKFHLAISLGLVMTTALSFPFVYFTNGLFSDPQTALYLGFFTTWFVNSLLLCIPKRSASMVFFTLLVVAICGLIIPILDQFRIASIDSIWLGLGIVSSLICTIQKRKQWI